MYVLPFLFHNDRAFCPFLFVCLLWRERTFEKSLQFCIDIFLSYTSTA